MLKTREVYYKILSSVANGYLRLKPAKLTVLAYHEIASHNNLEDHFKYLVKNYSVISKDQLYDFIYNDKTLPERAILVTFDDGDISNYERGLPLLKKYNIQAIFFVITDLINSNKPFWWDELIYYLGEKNGKEMVWKVKNWPNSQRNEYLQSLRANSGKSAVKTPQLTVEQLREIQQAGNCVGNHSATHPMFNQCTEEDLEVELNSSISVLKELNFSYNIFAYPNGNFSEVSEKKLKTFNIKLAFLFDHKLNNQEINPLRISRIRVNSNTSMPEFKVKVSGLHSYLYHKILKN